MQDDASSVNEANETGPSEAHVLPPKSARLADSVQRPAILHKQVAGVAQLVERQLPKLKVAGPSPVSRS